MRTGEDVRTDLGWIDRSGIGLFVLGGTIGPISERSCRSTTPGREPLQRTSGGDSQRLGGPDDGVPGAHGQGHAVGQPDLAGGGLGVAGGQHR
jgi:hypothetical protein